MFNMPYPFVPDPNLFGGNYNNKITDLEQQINRLNREFRRLEHRVKALENNNKQPYVLTGKNNNYQDDDGMYMV